MDREHDRGARLPLGRSLQGRSYRRFLKGRYRGFLYQGRLRQPSLLHFRPRRDGSGLRPASLQEHVCPDTLYVPLPGGKRHLEPPLSSTPSGLKEAVVAGEAFKFSDHAL